MKNPLIVRSSILTLLCWCILSVPSFSQNSVGIGTSNSNNHAVLELVSPNSDQGFLVPRLTTAQRTAPTFTNSLAASENGLLVYDSDLHVFYHWLNNQWTVIGQAQDLSLVGNILKITNNPNATSIDLSPYAGTNTDNQTLSLAGSTLSIVGGNSVNLSSVNTDAQNLSNTVIGTQRTINISGGTSTTIDVADNDNSITNEIQSLSLTGTNLAITSGNTVNLSTINTDNQDLALNTTTNILSLTNDATTVDLTPYKQNLTNTVVGTQRTINISGGTGTSIDVADNDNSITNEIQTLSLAGTTLSISGGNSVALPAAGVTGTGAADQVTFWSTATNVMGATNFKWDSKNSRLGVNTAAPLGNLHVTGSQFASTKQIPATGGYTIIASDYIVYGAPTVGVGTYNITLPDANTNIGRILIIRTSGTTGNKNSINVIRAGTDLLDGLTGIALDATLAKVYAITVVSIGGGNWITISKSVF